MGAQETRHPAEQDLALFATNDLTFFSRLSVSRHVRICPSCAQAIHDYHEITADLALCEPAIPGWDTLAAEMRANISLGLEAGACLPAVTPAPALSWFNPRLALAMASLIFLLGAGIALRPDQSKPAPTVLAGEQQSAKVDPAQQSVRVDLEGVTITNVYME